ncbi:hypothetical protein AVEN_155594-1 [Araneus ventricosus]|uniref:Integrase catalytic domain-containing protein n=1 Tax=Araneus ventricosus TaxID=182803 RepID=A0A4Y2F9K4_ARAVE|nr:hypothetical protein AVEN_155594-1 [Araneus ventricosus]
MVTGTFYSSWITSRSGLKTTRFLTKKRRLLQKRSCRNGSPDSEHHFNFILIKGKILSPLSVLSEGLFQLLQIDKTQTTLPHPQSDGMVERFN